MGSGLTGTVVSIDALTETDQQQMYEVFARYYADVSWERFVSDLQSKDDVIILRDPRHRVRGFSTLKRLALTIDGTTQYGIFSGDTVVDQAFWGTKVLGKVFLRYLFTERLRRPFSPLWWFLISKGYKTYLLMANNFPEHWPRHEAPTPSSRQAILDGFASQLFPAYYRHTSGLIEFPQNSGRLRQGVAAATEALTSQNPRIQFFVNQNPQWAEGVELACVANMSWTMPVRYALKAIRDRWHAQFPSLSERKA